MKIKNEKKLLSIFCDKEDFRPLIKAPFFNTKYNEVWSTEGHVLIRIEPENLVNEYPNGVLRMPKMEHPCEKTIFIDELSKALEARNKFDKMVNAYGMVECEQCGGSGDLVHKYIDADGNTHERVRDCPFCDGYGEIEYKRARNIVIEVGDSHFFANTLQILKQAMDFLKITSVKMTNNYGEEVSEFVVNDDIRIDIMPIASDYVYECNTKIELKES